MIKKAAILVFIAVCVLAFTQFKPKQDETILMQGIDGQQHQLDDYIGKGQWVVVNVWATACPYCRRELFDLASFHEKHANKDAMVLGLTLDLATFGVPDSEHVKNFAESYLIEYPLLLVSGELASQVTGKHVHTVPMTFFYNPEGKLVYHFTGEMDVEMLEAVINGEIPS